MSEVETIEVQEEVVENGKKPLRDVVDMTHKTVLAGLGAVALAQDEAADVFDKWVARGEEVEEQGRKRFEELRERRKKGTSDAEEKLDKRVEEILHRMNMPTQSDVKALNAKITELNKKIDELRKAQSE